MAATQTEVDLHSVCILERCSVCTHSCLESFTIKKETYRQVVRSAGEVPMVRALRGPSVLT